MAPKHNGRSDFKCPACSRLLGYVRKSSLELRTFAPADGIKTKYLTGGTLQLVCPCNRIVNLHW